MAPTPTRRRRCTRRYWSQPSAASATAPGAACPHRPWSCGSRSEDARSRQPAWRWASCSSKARWQRPAHTPRCSSDAILGRSKRPSCAGPTIESVAENTTDAVVGALLWGALAGAGGAAAYRAVNTLDAMVGHHSPRYERFGWAAARLDDLLSWPAARLAALLTVLLAPLANADRSEALRILCRDGRSPPQPQRRVDRGRVRRCARRPAWRQQPLRRAHRASPAARRRARASARGPRARGAPLPARRPGKRHSCARCSRSSGGHA